MVVQAAHNLWVPIVTLLIAFMLSALPMLEWVQWGWPEWVLIVFIYWVIALPHRFGLGWAFILGLLLDLLQGNHLGVNALAMVVVTFFCYADVSPFTHVPSVATSLCNIRLGGY